jgi:hypothetical protein
LGVRQEQNFRHFARNIFQRNFLSQILKKNFELFFSLKKSPKIATIAYNLKECSRFSTFIFGISPKLIKYNYGSLPLEQNHKIGEKQKKQCALMVGFLLKGIKLNHERLEVPRVNMPHTEHQPVIKHPSCAYQCW